MTILALLSPNETALRTEADAVGLPGIFIDQLIANLYETMYFHNALGLAASQIGILQKIAVMDVDNVKLTLINPKIIEKSDEMVDSEEGCLSCPDLLVTIPRHKEITILNYDINGKDETIKLTGQAAITAQHEINHLEGILITYKISSIKKHRYVRRVKKAGR